LQSTNAKTGISRPKALEFPDYDTPDLKFLALMEVERWVIGILGDEGNPASTSKQAFYQALAIHKCDNDVPVSWAHAFIDDQDVAIEYLSTFHGVAFDCKKEGTYRVANQVLVDVEASVLVVCRWTWESGRNLDGP
jgi:hypothetical protein